MPPRTKRNIADVNEGQGESASNTVLLRSFANPEDFCDIVQKGNKVHIRIGVVTSHEFNDNTEAQAYARILLEEKLSTGFVEERMLNAFAGNQDDNEIDYNGGENKRIKTENKANVKAPNAKSIHMKCTEGSSNKFYEMIKVGRAVTIRYGRCGTAGATSVKAFDNAAEATAFMNKTTEEKRKKGYRRTNEAVDLANLPAQVADINMALHEDEGQDSAMDEDTTEEASDEDGDEMVEVKTENKTNVKAEDTKSIHMKCTEGSSNKFYEMIKVGRVVTIRYGRCGTAGTTSVKTFPGATEATAFMNKTTEDKNKKGYRKTNEAVDLPVHLADMNMEGSGDLKADLENGLKVFVKGSSALPYTLKKFNGGYSCTCLGFTMNIKRNGIQANTCRHLRDVRGDDLERERCESSAGIKPAPGGGKQSSILSKISLAQKWNMKTDPTGYIMSEKLDGMRAYWCGGKLWTRNGNQIMCPDWFVEGLPEDLELDGELFLGRKLFDECMSIARRNDASDAWNKLQYIVFDAPTVKGGIMTRLAEASARLENSNSPYVVIHKQEECTGMEHLLEELARIEALDGEGLMLRSKTASHRGGRTTDLLKVKSFHDDEAIVLDYEQGKGKYQGQVGSLMCRTRNGALFKVGSGLTDQLRSFQAAPKKGTVITFKYFELTKDGIPRFPTFLRIRPDVDASEFN